MSVRPGQHFPAAGAHGVTLHSGLPGAGSASSFGNQRAQTSSLQRLGPPPTTPADSEGAATPAESGSDSSRDLYKRGAGGLAGPGGAGAAGGKTSQQQVPLLTPYAASSMRSHDHPHSSTAALSSALRSAGKRQFIAYVAAVVIIALLLLAGYRRIAGGSCDDVALVAETRYKQEKLQLLSDLRTQADAIVALTHRATQQEAIVRELAGKLAAANAHERELVQAAALVAAHASKASGAQLPPLPASPLPPRPRPPPPPPLRPALRRRCSALPRLRPLPLQVHPRLLTTTSPTLRLWRSRTRTTPRSRPRPLVTPPPSPPRRPQLRLLRSPRAALALAGCA